MLPPCALALVVARAWNVLAIVSDAPRVATNAPFVLVDGKLTTTGGPTCDALSAPLCSARTSVVVVALGRCGYFDVHVADAIVPATATAHVEMLVGGVVQLFRWRVVSPTAPLSRAQAVVASESMACERAYRLYVAGAPSRGAVACAAGAAGAAEDESVAVYRIVLCGVSGSVTRVRQGRALFANGPFADDVRRAPTCVRAGSADVHFDGEVDRAFGRVRVATGDETLRVPVASGGLVIVQFRAATTFARHELPAKCTARLLLLDGSVVTLTDETPSPMAVPLHGVVEARFDVPSDAESRAAESRAAESRAADGRAAEGRAADGRGAEGRGAESRATEGRAAESPAFRIATDRDGRRVVIACAPIVVM
jgi:hypothetical protein